MSQTTSTGSVTPSANTASQLQGGAGHVHGGHQTCWRGAAADGVTFGRMSLNKEI